MDIATTIIQSFELHLLGVATLVGVTIPLIFTTQRSIQSLSPLRGKIIRIIFSILALTASLQSMIYMNNKMHAVPKILSLSPKQHGSFDPIAPKITMRFNAPILYKSLSVHTYPETNITVTPSGYLWNLIPFGTKLTITPRATLPPGEQIMVYLSNIEGPRTRGFGGEQLLELTNPDINISEINITEEASNVPTSQTFIITFDRPMVSEKEWTIRMNPSHAMRVERKNKQSIEVTPETPLRQGVHYTMSIIQTPILLVQKTQEEMTRLGERDKRTIHFRTVNAVFISSIDVQGNSFNPTADFHIKFDQPMDRASVDSGISLSPATTLRFNWDDKDTSLTIDHPDLTKNSEYVLTMKAGLRTELGGKLESDSTYPFHTAGPMLATNISPSDSATGVSPASTIKIVFDQEVPQKASEYFHIEPNSTGKITITDKTLEFKPDNPMQPNTRYNITLGENLPSVYGLPLEKSKSFGFTTSPKEVILTVPYYRQQTNFTCNIAAARMLLAYRNIQTTEKDLIHAIGLGGKRGSGNPSTGYIDDYGTYWPAVLRGITTHRAARMITSGSLADILKEIDKGNPVMTWGQNGWSDPHDISWTATDGTFIKAINGMHSTVVRGYRGSVENPTLIYVNDPWRGQYTLEPNEFMRRWKYMGIALVID